MTSSVEEFYDEFTTQQLDAGINHRHLSIQRWLEQFGLNPTSKVLEIGCGIGTQTELLLRFLTSGSVTAIDISEKSINLAKQRLSKYSNVTFKAGDIAQISIEEKFDIILLPDVLEHIPISNHKELFEKLSGVIEEDGILVIHIPDPDALCWTRKVHPEQLQIIDQPIFLDELLKNLGNTDFKIEFLKSYSIYTQDPDYQIIMLKKNAKNRSYLGRQSYLNDSILRRIVKKIKYISRGYR